MQTIIHSGAITLFMGDVQGSFIARTLILGLLTFFFFFLLMRTLDRENIYKFNLKSFISNLKFVKYNNAVMLVKDGVLQLDKLNLAKVTPQQIYEAIRSKKIRNIAEVERLFLISGGEFSIYRKQAAPTELPVYQYSPKEMYDQQGKA
jgi:uncharacterized membrane protein YcaP (DUF421 family)